MGPVGPLGAAVGPGVVLPSGTRAALRHGHHPVVGVRHLHPPPARRAHRRPPRRLDLRRLTEHVQHHEDLQHGLPSARAGGCMYDMITDVASYPKNLKTATESEEYRVVTGGGGTSERRIESTKFLIL